MQSNAATVDNYLKEISGDRLEALTQIRKHCINELKGYEETMRYGMPCYQKNNVVEVSFANQKNNIALYILKQDVMETFKGDLKGVSTGKGCIRYTKPGKIDFEMVRKLLAATYHSKNAICG